MTTLYKSAPYIKEFYARAKAQAEKITDDYEIVFVNDGSPDNSLALAISLYNEDAKVRVVDLSRNFGHHAALMTGLRQTKGDYVFVIDCDIEEAPELLEVFFAKMKETGADVVYGVQKERKGGWFERFSGEIYYKTFNFLSSYPIKPNQLVARLMTRRYVSHLTDHNERDVFMAGLIAATGFDQVAVPVEKSHKGLTAYTILKRISLGVVSITSFSHIPLIVIFYLGFFILTVSIGLTLCLLFLKIFHDILPMGISLMLVSIWAVGGLIISSLGVIAVYLSTIMIEVKQRPLSIIKEIYERPS